MRSAVAVSTTGYAKALGLGAPGVLLKVKQSLEWTGWEAMHQQEATERVLVQRVGEMGGMIQFTQVEPEKTFYQWRGRSEIIEGGSKHPVRYEQVRAGED